MRDEVFLLGRILLALVFLLNGIGHLTKTEGSAGYAAYKKVPNPREAVLVSGVLMVLGALGVILGIWMDLAALGLAVLVLIMAFVMHRFWDETDPQTKAVEQAQFFKNVALAGGCLILVAVVADGFEPPYSITDGVF